MNPTEFLNYLKKRPYYQNQLVHVERIPAKRARYGKLETGLPASLVKALESGGTTRLFSHQAEAINAVRRGEHVVVATGTASGKTMCYNIPVFEAVQTSYRAKAIYLFPTKALGHDQLRTLSGLASQLSPRPRFGAYDGDTPSKTRTRLRQEANIILTNPDMLHLGILPNHNLWASFLRDLRFIVIDEAHVYRGVFGSHVSAVLQRLNRLCQHYGSQPQYIACSATISNPGEHVARLCGYSPTVVDNDGAPKMAKQFAFWNPPLRGDVDNARRSPYGEAAALFADLTRSTVRNITFTKARVIAELILKYARASLKRTDPDLMYRVASYRAGYLANHRREVEEALFKGELLGVTATNALELGVDVGGLDATISVGYPGSIASLWQQVGRAGRRSSSSRQASLAIMVGLDNPLDQYFMRHPEELFGRPHEHALIDPGNVYVAVQHLPCAASELPLTPQDEARFGDSFIAAMVELENNGTVVYQPDLDKWLYMGRDYPAQQVNIRSVGRRPVSLLDISQQERRLETMDASNARSRVHPGAIYIHQGESYQVKSLDLKAGVAKLVPSDADYFTQTLELNDIQVLQASRKQTLARTVVHWGTVQVTQHVVGYRRVRHFTEDRSKEVELNLPPNSFQTRALWWHIPTDWQKAIKRRGWRFSGGLHAIEHAFMALLPLFAMCDRLDIGGHTTTHHPETGLAQIFVYDAYPGGVGISEQGFSLIQDLWQATLSSIKECPCEDGCPSCIYSPKAGDKNQSLDKQAAIWILEALLWA
ncbi:MAG: DEAD/DEAH box helicase [Chloroflexota bacterium]